MGLTPLTLLVLSSGRNMGRSRRDDRRPRHARRGRRLAPRDGLGRESPLPGLDRGGDPDDPGAASGSSTCRQLSNADGFSKQPSPARPQRPAAVGGGRGPR